MCLRYFYCVFLVINIVINNAKQKYSIYYQKEENNMSKIRKIIYRNKMKLMENRHSTKGVYCHGAKKIK